MNLVLMSVLRKITESGVSHAETNSEKRNIVLSNYISLIAAGATLLLLLGRYLFATVNVSIALTLLQGCILFILPVILNRSGFINLSRFALCWLPPAYQLYATLETLKEVSVFETSTFVGLRFFMVAFSCFPFLVFDLRKKNFFIPGLLGPLLFLLFYDPILNFFGLGYWQVGLHDATYQFNNVRVFLSVMIVGSSSFFLKQLIEESEERNDQLIAELAEKNTLLHQQAADELHQLNQQLLANLQQLTEREFILNQSQRVAKIGSWEYRVESKSIFWSDELYSILGFDKGVDLTNPNLAETMWGRQSAILFNATKELLLTGQPYDLTLKTRTPLGYVKWIRIYAFPLQRDSTIIGATGICHDVTLYKESEERISLNEMKYRSLFEQASDAIMVTDFNGNFAEVNASLCSMFGYSREELLQLNISHLIDSQQLKTYPINFAALKMGDHIFSERSMVHKDGTIIEVEANVKRSGEGLVMAIVRDVTELRKAQKQIQLSEARFRGAFEYSATGMALVSLEGKWLKVNKELCHVVGYSEQELLALTFREITHPEDLSKDLAFLQQTLRGEIETYRMEKRYLHKNGSLVWVNLNVSLIKDTDGNPLYFVSQIEDITIEKKAQEKLVASQANLHATINNTEILIWSVDRNFCLLTFNQPFFNYMKDNYGVEIKPGTRVLEPTEPENAMLSKGWEQKYLRALAGEIITVEESRFGMDFLYSLSPIIEGNRIIGVSVFGDNITERKASDRELAEANKKMAELKLMALRSVMSPHFIFNVLNSIQFFIAKNDRLNAINYLSTFSKLIRSILTHSVTNKIKLTEEIEMLKNYVQLEMTRFENKFNFVLQVHPEVDVDGIEIPSLLIQPYVENAILHGLYNKTDPGTLVIRILEQEEDVIFEIEDDGIGRQAAMKLRQQNFPTHKSMGIKLTEERLKLINQQQHASFSIEDLVNQHGPSGTKVTIRVPI